MKQLSQNQTLIPFFCSTSKQSNFPLHNVAAFVKEYQFLTNWNSVEHDGWILPSTKEPHDWCGLWRTVGCLNTEQHEKLGKGRRIYVKQYQRSCYRAVCKTCYLKWMARQSNKATRRIEKYSELSNKKPIHVILCVPPSQHSLPVKLLRKRMNQILKISKMDGGAVVFHPFRFRQNIRRWYYSPHFHLVGFGNKQKIASAFGKYGWFIKICDERESVFQTFCYVLSHCGIKKQNHTLTWFGGLSYSKLKIENEPNLGKCPVCGRKFIEIYHDGVHPVVPPDKLYEGLVDSGDWYEVETIPKSEWTRVERYEYALEKELYNANKGILGISNQKQNPISAQ